MTIVSLLDSASDVLVDCTRKAIAELQASSCNNEIDTVRVSQLQKMLGQTMHRALCSGIRTASSVWDARHSTRALLTCLPVKVICRVLQYLPLEACVAASHTCRRVRSIALGAAHPWTSVRVGPPRPSPWAVSNSAAGRQATDLSCALSMLRRSCGLPGRIWASFDASDFETDARSAELLQAILADAAMLRLEPFEQLQDPFSLSLVRRGPGSRQAAKVMCPPSSLSWSYVREALCTPAPCLRALEIHIPENLESWIDGPYIPLLAHDSVLAGDPAQLRYCHLNGVTLGNCSALSSLTVFDYQPRPDVMGMRDISAILTGMPSLQTLGLAFQFIQEVQEIVGTPLVAHGCLTRVCLALPPVPYGPVLLPEKVSYLVAYFDASCTRADVAIAVDLRVDAEIPHFAISQGVLPARLAEHPHDIFAGHRFTVFREANIMLLTSQRMMSYSTITSATLTNLVCLALSESMWPDVVSLSAPRLKSLTVILQACTQYRLNICQTPNIFVSAALLPAWACPALEVLRIAYEPVSPPGVCVVRPSDEAARFGFSCACKNGCVLSLGDVCHFVRTGLRFSAPRLRELALSGLRGTAGDADPVAAFLALQELADTVVVDEAASDEILEARALYEQRIKRSAYYWAPSHVFDPRPASTDTRYDFFDFVGRQPLPVW